MPGQEGKTTPKCKHLCSRCGECFICCECIEDDSTMPVAIDTDEGRRRLADLIVWGTHPKEVLYSRTKIELRIIHALERIKAATKEKKDGHAARV